MDNIYLGVGGVDIPVLSMSMAQANLTNEWSMGIMSKALDQVELQSQMMADLLAGIPQPVPVEGSSFSVRI